MVVGGQGALPHSLHLKGSEKAVKSKHPKYPLLAVIKKSCARGGYDVPPAAEATEGTTSFTLTSRAYKATTLRHARRESY